MSNRYDPKEIEPKWQKQWLNSKAFRTPKTLKELGNKPKFYILDMFPYPSGAGLHVGHPEGYTATDIVARYKKMKGFNVLHPMGWDAFGLPAERAAVREGIHPAIITKRNIDNFRRQIQRLGFGYDWDREVDTSAPDYYKWTQWIFLKLFEKGLAYLADVPVNWCPALGTVLANEEVKDGKYVDTGDPVERRLMKQWMLKITVYAERLIEDLDGLDWPESVKEMQRNWIGKSEGAEIRFQIDGTKEFFEVFTTRPDTLFGCTYCVLAPEHPLVSKITAASHRSDVDRYVTDSKNKTDLARTDLAKEKTGAFTGAYALHPFSGSKLPIYVADYVLMTYGSGAIMAVPAHDERDQEFAVKFNLPILKVIEEGDDIKAGKRKMIEALEAKGLGRGRVQYKLRDWLFSRQRYWGEPFPIAHTENEEVVALPESELPVLLPPIDEYRPTEDGRPPLARAGENWLRVKLPNGSFGMREVNTMPQWAGSCWYYLRYIDARNEKKAWEPELEKYWMPVDLYIGGVEHAVLHLLYARFWHKVLFDCGLVSTKEPFQKLFNQGMILAHSYQDKAGKYYGPDQVEERNGQWFAKGKDEALKTQIEKMSKSRMNVFNPDDVIDQYGADSMRLYEMFMGPLEQVKPWQMSGVEGVYRFLARTHRFVHAEGKSKLADVPASSEPELEKILHRTIKKVGEDIEGLRFNTAISQMMVFVNEATSAKRVPLPIFKDFLRVLCPFAPHLAEELWESIGEKPFLSHAEWPAFDPKLCSDDTIEIAIQVNGKLRDTIVVLKSADKTAIEAAALQSEKVRTFLAGATPKRVIVVPGRLVNFVL